MKNKFTLLYPLAAILILFPGCDDNDRHCSYIKALEVEAGCYDPKVGLMLTAIGAEEEGKEYQWEVWVLKGKSDGLTPTDAKHIYNGLVVTLTDNLLSGNDQVMAQIFTYCDSEQLTSQYFKFTRETSGTCTTWVPLQ